MPFRSLFAVPEGYRLVVADYSQVELRVAALIAPDKTMLEAYKLAIQVRSNTPLLSDPLYYLERQLTGPS